MFRPVRTFMYGMMLTAAVMCSSGCFLLLGAAAGVGGYAWINGDLEKEYQVNVDKLHSAAVKAMEKLDMAVHEDKSDHLSALIKAKSADGKEVTISVAALTEKSVKVKIRVGVFGDEAKSQLIASKIEKYL